MLRKQRRGGDVWQVLLGVGEWSLANSGVTWWKLVEFSGRVLRSLLVSTVAAPKLQHSEIGAQLGRSNKCGADRMLAFKPSGLLGNLLEVE